MEVAIREYRQDDHRAIAEIFPRAVHEIASKDYTLEQCLAWSDREPNPAHWEKRCARKRPFVAEVGGEIAGFLELDPDGHIDCAYVHPDYQRRGVMMRLVEHAVALSSTRGVKKVYVEASITARPLFEKCGFKAVAENVVTIKGVALLNYRMERMQD
jgi:ribosomal protein S18 acetylase RimI-like enzyme